MTGKMTRPEWERLVQLTTAVSDIVEDFGHLIYSNALLTGGDVLRLDIFPLHSIVSADAEGDTIYCNTVGMGVAFTVRRGGKMSCSEIRSEVIDWLTSRADDPTGNPTLWNFLNLRWEVTLGLMSGLNDRFDVRLLCVMDGDVE